MDVSLYLTVDGNNGNRQEEQQTLEQSQKDSEKEVRHVRRLIVPGQA